MRNWKASFKNKGYTYEFFDATFCLIKKYPQKREGFFEIKFNWRRKNQLNYEIKVPGFTGLVTQHFNDMSVMLKELIYYRLKTCDGCGYCTQTNKTAKKVLAVQLDANGNKAVKCPLYPWLVWENLDGETVLIIKELIDFSEKNI